MLLRCMKPIETCSHPPDCGVYDVFVPGLGKLRGERRISLYHETYYAFENIPYGYRPVDSLRFKAPWKAEKWKYTKNCTKSGNMPIQVLPNSEEVLGTEDCLNLNIYVKNIRTVDRYPVIVFLPGGDFVINQAADHKPDYFMFEECLLITINFRVGALGFLTLKDFELEVPGNAGLKDIVLALKWIHKNCGYFNGDSRNICLAGYSSGAAAAHILSCSPQAKGLFQKVILQSGTMLCQWSFLPQSSVPYRLALANGYTGPDEERHILTFLRLLPPQVLSNWNLLTFEDFSQGILFPFAPTIEPYDMEHTVIRSPYLQMMAKGWGNRIPMMIGGTSFEGLYINQFKPLIASAVNEDLATFTQLILLPPELKQLKKKQIFNKEKKLLNSYFGSEQEGPTTLKQTYLNFLDLCSIRFFWHGIHRTVLFRHKYSFRDTFQYRFDFDSPDFNLQRQEYCSIDFKRGVAHGDDMYYLFRLWNSFKVACDSAEYQTIRKMIAMWVSFARNSNPNYQVFESGRSFCDYEKIAPWKSLCESDAFSAFNISYECEFMRLPETKKLRLWDSLYPVSLY